MLATRAMTEMCPRRRPSGQVMARNGNDRKHHGRACHHSAEHDLEWAQAMERELDPQEAGAHSSARAPRRARLARLMGPPPAEGLAGP
jgi:hypothetical protein